MSPHLHVIPGGPAQAPLGADLPAVAALASRVAVESRAATDAQEVTNKQVFEAVEKVDARVGRVEGLVRGVADDVADLSAAFIKRDAADAAKEKRAAAIKGAGGASGAIGVAWLGFEILKYVFG